MPRPILAEAQIHPAVRDKIAGYHADIVKEVQAAVAANAIVVVGMRKNAFTKGEKAGRPPPTRPSGRSPRTTNGWTSTPFSQVFCDRRIKFKNKVLHRQGPGETG